MRLGNYSISNYLVILATAIACILLSGQVKYWLPENSNMDLNKYLSMAEAFPNLNTTIIKPFVYRIIAPWLAGSLPFAIPVNFYLLNFIFLILFSFVFLKFLIEHKIDSTIALVLTISFQLNRYFFQFLSWNYFHLTDTLSYVILFYSFILLRNKKWLQLFLLLPLGILIKEYVILIIPVGYAYLLLQKPSRDEIIKFSILTILMVVVFLGIRFLIKAESGESLFTQYFTQVVYYSNPIALIKRFIIPFTPFGLLPIIFYKEVYNFFVKYKYLFIYFLSVLAITFFGEPERLIAPLAPIYFTFIGFLLQSIFDKGKYFHSKRFTFAVIIVLSFLSSFYHLWGIIKLPSSTFTIISTIILSVTILLFFVLLNKKVQLNISNK
ncbi:MAG: hypothetical protein GY936_03610 [Ignavibacteriae bacterium]|nr:hypothetical protein [Ignavibacteriota bacterium]